MTADLSAWLSERRKDCGADLRINSKDIRKGDVFLACKGRSYGALEFVEDAVARGAGAVLIEGESTADLPASPNVPVLFVPDLSSQLGFIADYWYDSPSQKVQVIAITGTNGKTTSANWLAQALNNSGQPCASIGTLGMIMPDGTVHQTGLTTPDVVTFHRLLSLLVNNGIGYAVVEASSIGIAEGRLDHIRVTAAAFTNLTQDHLDYHGDMQHYEASKLALFRWPGLQSAVINLDDECGRRFYQAVTIPNLLSYSTDAESADIYASALAHEAAGMRFILHLKGQTAEVKSNQNGAHNLSNLLLTAGLLNSLGFSVEQIASSLSHLRPVPGRMQSVNAMFSSNQADNEPLVLVDYAHTPDALCRVLQSLQQMRTQRGGKLICVFGCGGDRDRGKRPLMGQAALDNADYVYVTSDNPRSEDPAAILADICHNLQGDHLESDEDRAFCILKAILHAAPQDIILIAGKGHETYQDRQGVKRFFDDRQWGMIGLVMRRQPAISTDSRSIGEGEFFVTLKGERFDAHDFLPQVAERHAGYALVDRPCPDINLCCMQVQDTLSGLQTMARAWRTAYKASLIAVVGSNGKTTTKEMIHSILQQASGGADNCFATPGNLNNHIGVPLSILKLRSKHKYAVLEMGMNHPGEIALLADIARPDAAVLTNAQREHQEFMKDVRAVAVENGSVFEYLPQNGKAVFPGADEFTALWQKISANVQQYTFGFDKSCASYAVTGLGSACDDTNSTNAFTWHHGQTAHEITLNVPGLHNISNAVAAATVCSAVGIGDQSIIRGLADFKAVKGRMQIHQHEGLTVIDDTYNANPDSVIAAINVLCTLPGPTALVLGNMAEVGENSAQMHAEVGKYAADKSVNHLFCLGNDTQNTVQAFGENAQHFESIERLQVALAQTPLRSVLVKGSRSMRMERIIEFLLKNGV